MSEFQKTTAYLIRCETGCSCCRADNELRGPWETLAGAEAAKKSYEAGKLLSSQYAPNGRYTIRECTAEHLPDGRLILDNLIISAGFLGETDTWNVGLLCGEPMHLLPGASLGTAQERAA